MPIILVADSERDIRDRLGAAFRNSGHEVDLAEDGTKAVRMIHARNYDLVISDLALPGKDGLEVIKEGKKACPDCGAIVTGLTGTTDVPVQAFELGASDFVRKPFAIAEMAMRVQKALKMRSLMREVQYLRHTQDVIYRVRDIVGESEGIQHVLRQVKSLTDQPDPVLIRGETGTGRQLIAGAIHFNGHRADYGFVSLSAAIRNPDHLKSDIFGHVKNAYPEATTARVGRIEQAGGGTVFIEEIAEMPSDLQARTFEFLKTGSFRRFGGTREISVDVRVIASTGRDLKTEANEGRFLPELAEFLERTVVAVPPLRDRKEDIRPLARYFLDRLRVELDSGRAAVLSEKAIEKLMDYNWPGNIRELKNVLERALFTSGKDVLEPSDIQLPEGEAASIGRMGSERKLKDLEKEAVIQALEKSNYVQKDAAKLLGISKRVIHYKIQQFGIRHPKWIRNR
ncbi:MAG: sigma-54-dependent Fis family transcriptional regulator [Proteobacteria bacterium]|nr:sigma-54-dependent Fis family transcriptional regulator [Pseudomonadota bacterium]